MLVRGPSSRNVRHGCVLHCGAASSRRRVASCRVSVNPRRLMDEANDRAKKAIRYWRILCSILSHNSFQNIRPFQLFTSILNSFSCLLRDCSTDRDRIPATHPAVPNKFGFQGSPSLGCVKVGMGTTDLIREVRVILHNIPFVVVPSFITSIQ